MIVHKSISLNTDCENIDRQKSYCTMFANIRKMKWPYDNHCKIEECASHKIQI